ncbi:MAG TPA: sensor histidine kinase [Firmicutes bacterium]|nr:sensor histidine kinase [Bacillota bacterium]
MDIKERFQMRSWGLKKKLLLGFMFIAFIPAVTISVFYYVDSKKALEANVGDTYVILLAHILNNVEQQIEEAYQFTNWLYLDRDVLSLLQRTPEEAKRYDQQNINVVQKIENQFRFLPIMEHVNAFFLLGHNGIDIRYGPDSYRIDPAVFANEPWFQQGISHSSVLTWGAITPNYSSRTSNPYIIPVYRGFIDIQNGKILGSIVLQLKPSFFRQSYSGLVAEKEAFLFIHDASGRLFFSDHYGAQESAADWSQLLEGLIEEERPYFEVTAGNQSYLVVHRAAERTKTHVTLITRLDELQRQRQLIAITTFWLAGGTIFLCLWFSLFLSENLWKPIRSLTETVNRIAGGDFGREVVLRNNDEIGVLGRAITRMSQQIQNLLDERLQIEENIRKTEVRLLQSQINPHFLHNTLNSIKWMATLQGADGIRAMISSLGRLLRAVMGDVNEKITIREELALLDDYMYIQKIRYRGKIGFRRIIEAPVLLNCLIPKFTLQPLVENAVFHGIEPKDGSGEVVLSITEQQQQLVISVWDNGVGISRQKLVGLLAKEDGDRGKANNGIGLRNIHDRIQLIYGVDYGLALDSREGEYTKVVIRLPMEVKPDGESDDC